MVTTDWGMRSDEANQMVEQMVKSVRSVLVMQIRSISNLGYLEINRRDVRENIAADLSAALTEV